MCSVKCALCSVQCAKVWHVKLDKTLQWVINLDLVEKNLASKLITMLEFCTELLNPWFCHINKYKSNCVLPTEDQPCLRGWREPVMVGCGGSGAWWWW